MILIIQKRYSSTYLCHICIEKGQEGNTLKYMQQLAQGSRDISVASFLYNFLSFLYTLYFYNKCGLYL